MDLSGPFIRGQGDSPDRPTRLADGLGLKVPWFDSANLRPGAAVSRPKWVPRSRVHSPRDSAAREPNYSSHPPPPPRVFLQIARKLISWNHLELVLAGCFAVDAARGALIGSAHRCRHTCQDVRSRPGAFRSSNENQLLYGTRYSGTGSIRMACRCSHAT